MSIVLIILVMAIGYAIGSIPTAYVIARWRGVDIFEVGSGNMGANNVWRTVGFSYGLAVLLLDATKGIVAILIARQIWADHQALASALAAVSVVAGHNWSFLATIITGSIRGGKGAATASGTFLFLAPTLLVALVLGLGALIVLVTRYVSLGVLIAIGASGVVMVALIIAGIMEPAYILYLLVCVMVFVAHRGNIVRLLRGTERRWGDSRKS